MVPDRLRRVQNDLVGAETRASGQRPESRLIVATEPITAKGKPGIRSGREPTLRSDCQWFGARPTDRDVSWMLRPSIRSRAAAVPPDEPGELPVVLPISGSWRSS